MQSEYLINIHVLTILEQVKRTPNIRKRKLYTSTQMQRVLNTLLDKDCLRILHPTHCSSSVSITGKGQTLLNNLWAAIETVGEVDLYKKEIEDRIFRNEAAAASRDESSRNLKRKTTKYDPNEYILKDGEFIPRSKYYASVEKEE